MGEVSSTDTTDYITKNELPLPLTLIRVVCCSRRHPYSAYAGWGGGEENLCVYFTAPRS